MADFPTAYAELVDTLQRRYDANPERHPGMEWKRVADRLSANSTKLETLEWMEKTGGEPDVVVLDPEREEVCFVDCSPESPDRRSLCYDRAALDARKENKPVGAAMELAASMGVQLLDEAEYRILQTYGKFDQKTSSWLATPLEVRKLGGAIFGDRRYDRVFIYHNGVQSYYASRGFRATLWV